MRAKFFLYLLIVLILCAVGFFLWQVIRAVFSTAVEFKTGRELDKLAGEFRQKRTELEQQAVERLKNGCEHDFHDDGGALPPHVCRRCGIAQVKPEGECDHQWIRVAGIVPGSRCNKCGKEYTSVGGAK